MRRAILVVLSLSLAIVLQIPAVAKNLSQEPSDQDVATASTDLSRIPRTRDEAKWAIQVLKAYPPQAKREKLEGTVGISLTINHQGRATSCAVIRSSGHPVLDEAACNSMVKHARFDPALDKEGKPTTGVFRTRITWKDTL